MHKIAGLLRLAGSPLSTTESITKKHAIAILSQGEERQQTTGVPMLNLYAVKLWHASAPHYCEIIEIRSYTARRAEHLASESYPGCAACASVFVGGAWCELSKDHPSRAGTRRHSFALSF